MSGAGDEFLHVSSWGWADRDGQPCEGRPDACVFRLWSVTNRADERIAMLLLPTDKDAGEALDVAYAAFGNDVAWGTAIKDPQPVGNPGEKP